MINNPSAKNRFLQDTIKVSKHQEMVQSETFQGSTDTALLQYQEELQFSGKPTDLNQAAGSYLRLLGAREFLFILRNLGEKVTPSKPVLDTLNLETRNS